jgi:hypothetical protein
MSQSRSVITARNRRLAAVGYSLTVASMHTASDVFVILKAGQSPRNSSRKSVAVDH